MGLFSELAGVQQLSFQLRHQLGFKPSAGAEPRCPARRAAFPSPLCAQTGSTWKPVPAGNVPALSVVLSHLTFSKCFPAVAVKETWRGLDVQEQGEFTAPRGSPTMPWCCSALQSCSVTFLRWCGSGEGVGGRCCIRGVWEVCVVG